MRRLHEEEENLAHRSELEEQGGDDVCPNVYHQHLSDECCHHAEFIGYCTPSLAIKFTERERNYISFVLNLIISSFFHFYNHFTFYPQETIGRMSISVSQTISESSHSVNSSG